MRRNQLTITYPEGDAQQLHQALLLLKRSRCLNVSAFCRAAIAEKLERLEAERAAILQKLDGPTPSPVRLLPNLAEAYRKKVSDLHAAIYSEETRDEAFKIIRTLIDKVLIHEGPNKKSTIELVGDIASMVDIAMHDPKTQKTARERAVLSDQEKRSVKVVAGTGFEPVTFRL